MDLFNQGNELFRQANVLALKNPEEARELYQKSAMRFERIIREGGIHNGKLYYNIGNAYFRMKDMGRAILNYRRAEQYIPNDANLCENLHYARTRRLDKIEIKEKILILKTLFFWHYDISPQTRSTLFASFFALFWLFAAIRLFFVRPWTGWGITIAVALSFIFFSSLLVDTATFKRDQPGVVISPEVMARKGDSKAYEKSFKKSIHAGTEFRVIEDRGNWIDVELDDGRRCWLPSNSVGMVR